MPDGTLVFSGVERRTFTKDGQETPVWNMKDGEGRRFSTFNGAIAKAIEEHAGRPLAAQWSEKQKGEYLNRTIVALPGLVERQQGGRPSMDEDRADRRAALMAAVTWCGSPDVDESVWVSAEQFLAWLRGDTGHTSAGGGPSAHVPVTQHDTSPAEPPRNPWNVWIEEAFPHLSSAEHRRLVKAALTIRNLEKLPPFDSAEGEGLRAAMAAMEEAP